MIRSKGKYDIVIIGAGASGMFAALSTVHIHSGIKKVLLIDRNPSPGRKLAVTGGGRCNITNANVSPSDYQTDSKRTLASILKCFSVEDTLNIFDAIGIKIKFDKYGKGYPESNSALDVKRAMINALIASGIDFLQNETVCALNSSNGTWVLTTSNNRYISSCAVIVASGSKACSNLGADDSLLEVLKKAQGLEVTPTVPALHGLSLEHKGVYADFTQLSGMSINGVLTLSTPQQKTIKNSGDILFTHQGISGPTVFDISGNVSRHYVKNNSKLLLSIGVFRNPQQTYDLLIAAIQKQPQAMLRTVLRRYIPAKLSELLFPTNSPVGNIKKAQLYKIAQILSSAQLYPSLKSDWDNAEVTSGGIKLGQLHPKTLAFKRSPGLFFCGEILDVDGRVGGYNLQWAWTSGWVAGRAAAVYTKQSKS